MRQFSPLPMPSSPTRSPGDEEAALLGDGGRDRKRDGADVAEVAEGGEVALRRHPDGVQDGALVGGAHLVADDLVGLLRPKRKGLAELAEGLDPQGHAVLQHLGRVRLRHVAGAAGDAGVRAPGAEAMVLGRAAGDPADQAMPRGRERGVRQENGDRAGTAGQGGDRLAQDVHAFFPQQPLDRQADDLARRFAGHHQPGLHLAELDGVGDLHHAVQDTEAGVGHVVDLAFRPEAQRVGNGAGGRRFEVFAADRPVDQHPDPFAGNPGGLQGLAAGAGRTRVEREIGVPVAPLPDAGDGLELPLLDAERFVKRLELPLQVIGRDDIRRQFVAERGNGYARIFHGQFR